MLSFDMTRTVQVRAGGRAVGWLWTLMWTGWSSKSRNVSQTLNGIECSSIEMLETLVINVQADFGLRVAREWANCSDLDRVGIEMGTDDVLDAYKVIYP